VEIIKQDDYKIVNVVFTVICYRSWSVV